MFSKKNKYIKYVHVYIIYTNTRFTFLCFSANAVCVSAFLFSQVSSSTVQFRWAQPAVAAATPSHRHPEVALSVPGAQLKLPAQFFSFLCLSPAGFGCRELLRCARGAASTLGTPVSSLPWAMDVGAAVLWKLFWSWNTDYSKKCILHLSLYLPRHSFILGFSL